MQDDTESRPAFLNRRDWSSYLTALQNATPYPKVRVAVRSSRNWFSQGASQASTWWVGGAELRNKLSVG